MKRWPSKRIQELLGIELPIIQAPMAGCDSIELALAVAEAGALGSLACTLLSAESLRAKYQTFRKKSTRPINLNFFCHKSPTPNPEQESRWRSSLKPFYEELGIDQKDIKPGPVRMPFDDATCALVEELKPGIVSFHFGLPERALLDRLKRLGVKILASATSVEEALWLESQGCDAIIAQGVKPADTEAHS